MSEDLQQDELQTLKAQADKMGITYHPSIGVEKLREKIADKLKGKAADSEGSAPQGTSESKVESENAFRLRKRREAEELVRIQVTCMNPNKKEYDGEVFTAGNSVVGTFKKYVPFGVEWHVPRIIYNMIKQKQCQIIVKRKDAKGRDKREGKLIREFNVVDLPPLTEQELQELKQRQAMANGTQA